MNRPAVFLLIIALSAGSASRAIAQSLVVDISESSISITANFTGKDILLFGAVDMPSDIVVVVQGPRENMVVRRKGRVSGIWMNRRSVTFPGVPAYYAVASNRPLDEIASQAVQAQYRIGSTFLDLAVDAGTPYLAGEELRDFREAILRSKRQKKLYLDTDNSVLFRERLFRTSIVFPTSAPEGDYAVTTYLLRDGLVIEE
ncbi:TIGR02186 family protein, partial [bacterium]|nr:TIGR02186 family protein [bacterium]